jgi:predicted ATPase/class 3 adenylate cyclase
MAARGDQRKSLPRGRVTLLFGDVEGSTRLLYALGGRRYAGVRARARELVRAAAARHGGAEVDWAGDGVFLAFHGAQDAVEAAAELQRALAVEPWPQDAAVRLRVGVHTGEPELGPEGYVGADVHLAARICGASHGGQVVVSRATRDLAAADAPEGVSFRPLGRHRLKDIPDPEPLFQLVAPELERTFPPLQTLGGATLPAFHHRLVGRVEELAHVQALLERPDVRLVTVAGAGGTGKSRLALEVAAAAAAARPVQLVGLAPISDDALVPSAIARALGVREAPGRTLTELIADSLTNTATLLLLDNLEHLPSAAQHVAALLDRVPDLDVLATSRTPLRLAGEHLVPLEPLSSDDAATLFLELASARGVRLQDDWLPAIREICRRLDGLPLAIELVVAPLAVLPPAQLLEALAEGLALDLEGPVDLPERQRTLRATLDWSHGLLGKSQRALLGQLAVFAGGCTLEDARAVAGTAAFLSDLEALVSGSLVRSDAGDGEVRLSMLETVREDALARLAAAGTLEEARRRHAERFLELAARAEPELEGPQRVEWLERLERELDNLRVALDWCVANGGVEDVLRAVASLGRFWRAHGHVTEARRWLAQGLAQADGVAPDVRADALWTAAHQADAQSDWDAAEPLLQEALPLFRESGRRREVVFTLSELGFIGLLQGDPERAAGYGEEALAVARELGDARALSGALESLGQVRSIQGDHERALALHEEAVALRRELGDPLLVSGATYNLAVAAFKSGDLARAREAVEEALSLSRELGESLHTAAAQILLALLDLFEGAAERAEERVRESLALYRDLENDRDCAECLAVLAAAAAARGSSVEAARLLGASDRLRGGAPLSGFEQVALDRCVPELEAELGADRVAELRVEGALLDEAPILEGVAQAGSTD